MTVRKNFKKKVRTFAAEHGMSYQAALQKILLEEKPDGQGETGEEAQGRGGVHPGGLGPPVTK